MAYQALYRTYRPTNFSEVAGQKHIIKTLQNAVEKNKIAHAYLFCGPRGTGKTTVARILAKAVNCTSDNSKPCDECPNCKEISEGRHPDVIEIDAASNNGVDEIRDLIEKVKFSTSLGKYKVYIIDEVHMLSTGAFNALLKTLEEPPAHVIFIMATTEPLKVLPTIISRCQRYDFGKIADIDIINYLKDVCVNEKINIDDESLKLIAVLAEGGLRDALSILDQCVAYANDNVTIEVINDIYGITTIKEKINLLSYIKAKDLTKVLELYNEYIDKGIDIKKLCADLVDILKESIIYHLSNGSIMGNVLNHEEHLHLNALFNVDQKFKMIENLISYSDKFKFAVNINKYFELCLLKLTSYDEVSIDKEEVVPNKVVAKQAEVNKVSKIEKKASKKLITLNEDEIINLLIQASKEDRVQSCEVFKTLPNYFSNDKYRSISKLISDGVIVASNTDFVLIATRYSQQASIINDGSNQDILVRLMKEMFGKERMLFAISLEARDKAINTFRVLSSSNHLPTPQAINIIVVNDEEKASSQSADVEDKLQLLFGDLLEIQED